ncbi:hypothetical protein MOC47_18495 [Bacillus spizizenii]|uniref:hypothetical protein n=1 Tax=Bacillus spizizenii TaxID=96241 RepID=UPI000A59008C|nr:hypothetical protein [Bacillus spizizenii]MCY8330776.1 hypothetical protein [Bacillus spizizenii]
MIRIYETGDSQFNNLAAAWSKLTHHDKDLFEVSAIILASDHQEKEAEKIASGFERINSIQNRKIHFCNALYHGLFVI